MTIHIIEVALKETLEYMRKLNSRNTFQSHLDRYAKLHRNGKTLQVHKSFGSVEKMFDHFSKRFGIDNFQLGEVNKGFQNEMNFSAYDKALETKIEKWREEKNILHAMKKTAKELIQQLGSHSQVLEVHQELTERLDRDLAVIQTEIDKVSVTRKLIHQIGKKEVSMPDAIREQEFLYARVVLKYYLGRVEYYSKNLFPNTLTYIDTTLFNWENIFKKVFKEQPIYKQEGFSVLENQVYSALVEYQTFFTVNVYKGDIRLHLSKDYASCFRKVKSGEEEAQEQVDKAENKVKKFLSENPLFQYLLFLHVEASELKVPFASSQLINMELSLAVGQELIDKYNSLIQQLQQAKETLDKERVQLRTIRKSSNPNRLSIKEAFPQLTSDEGEVKDWARSVIEKKEVMENRIFAVSNGQYLLQLSQRKEE